jgi:glycosyltransferase involved in cell wall biosynthesis
MARRFIVWKLNHADPLMASVRYRALLPAFADAQLTERSILLDGHSVFKDVSQVRALILVKTFRSSDLDMARAAARNGIPLFYDLCDNIYAEGYGGRTGRRYRAHFEAMATLAQAIVTTGPALGDALRRAMPAHLADKVVEQPDPFETSELVQLLLDRDRWPNPEAARAIAKPATVLENLSHIRRSLRRLDPRRLKSEAAGTAPTLEPRSGDDLPQVIWFGSAGNQHSKQGLAALAAFLEPLREAHARAPFRLHVVSNNAELYRQLIQDKGLPTSYEQWTPLGIFAALKRSRACVLPAVADSFSQTKSANRLILALSHCVPVVASSIPAYAEFKDFVYLDDFASGLIKCLSDTHACARALEAFRASVMPDYTPQRAARRWLERIGAD